MGKVTIGWIPEKTKKNKAPKANQQPKADGGQTPDGQNPGSENQQEDE